MQARGDALILGGMIGVMHIVADRMGADLKAVPGQSTVGSVVPGRWLYPRLPEGSMLPLGD